MSTLETKHCPVCQSLRPMGEEKHDAKECLGRMGKHLKVIASNLAIKKRKAAMSDIQRFGIVIHNMAEEESGRWVTYEDHAALLLKRSDPEAIGELIKDMLHAPDAEGGYPWEECANKIAALCAPPKEACGDE